MVKLTMMVGPSYSGKSYIANELVQKNGGIIISSDAIREELYGDEGVQKNPSKVFEIAHERIREALKNEQDVYFDATNLSSKRRISFLKTINQMNIEVEKNCVVVATSFSKIMDRAKMRKRVVPWEVVWKQIQQFQCPYYFEGWDNISIVKNDFAVPTLEEILQSGKRVPHDNPHHELSITDHMIASHNFYRANFDSLNDCVLEYAIRYHDIGKFFTKSFFSTKGERRPYATYRNHHYVGSYLVLSSRSELEPEEELQAAVLIEYHMEHFMRTRENMDKLYESLGAHMANQLKVLETCDENGH